MIDKKKALANFHREVIRTAAEKLFSENGIEKTTMDDIAKKAEYSKATIYVYFKSKDEIIGAIALISMKTLLEKVKATAGIPDFIGRYYAMCYEIVKFKEKKPLYFDTALGEINTDIGNPSTPEVFHHIFKIGEELNLEVKKLLLEGISKGILRRDIIVSQTVFILWANISGIVRMASQKKEYIEKTLGVTANEFLRCGFDTVLRSVLA